MIYPLSILAGINADESGKTWKGGCGRCTGARCCEHAGVVNRRRPIMSISQPSML